MHTYSIEDNALLDRGREGDKLEAKDFYNYTTSYNKTTHTLTLTLTVPADPTATTNVGVFPIYVRSGSESDAQTQTLNVYYAAPQSGVGVFELASGGKAYFSAVGSKLYYYVMLDKANLTEADIKLDGLYLNVNGGAAENVGNIDLGFTYAEGELTLKDTSGAINPFIGVNGTTADPYDIDHGFFFMGEVDVTKFGIETGAATWYFQVMQDVKADAEKNVYKVTTANGETTVAENTDAVTQNVEVVKQSCDSTGLTASVIKSGDDIVFIFNAVYTTSHFWEKDADNERESVYVCSKCGAIYTDTVLGVKHEVEDEEGETSMVAYAGFETGALKDAKTKGLTVSFAYSTTTTNDWSIIPVKTTTNNLIIAGGTVDPWNVTTDGLEGEFKTLAEGMQKANLYPGKASGSQIGDSVSPYQETQSGYTTIVVDPAEGILFYVNGDLKIHYTLTHEATGDNGEKSTVANIIKLFLELAEKSGVTVAPGGFDTANYAIVQVGVLDEKAVATRYNNYLLEEATYPTAHTWSTDKTSANYDHCTTCGVMNPKHGTEEYPHVYVQGRCIACNQLDPNHTTHTYGTWDSDDYDLCTVCDALNENHATHRVVNGVCTACGWICEHDFDTTTNKCKVCGATATTTAITANNSFDNQAPWVWYELPNDVTITRNSSFSVTGTTKSDMKEFYHSIYWEVKEGFTGRMDNYGWTFGQSSFGGYTGVTSIVDADGKAVDYDWEVYRSIAKDATWSIEFRWGRQDTLTVIITMTAKSGTHTGYTYTDVLSVEVTNTALTEMHVHLCNEGTKNYTIDGYTKLAYGTAPVSIEVETEEDAE